MLSSPQANALPSPLCHLDGGRLTLPEAKVSARNRGFIFGGGVHEVVPIHGGHLCCFDAQMTRLDRLLAELRMPAPRTHDDWRDITRAEVFDADELQLLSASKGMPAVSTLDERPVGKGRPDPIYERLYAAHRKAQQAAAA